MNGEMDHATWVRYWGDVQHTIKTASKQRRQHPGSASFGQMLMKVHTEKREKEAAQREAAKKKAVKK
jgi:hypothetical protein